MGKIIQVDIRHEVFATFLKTYMETHEMTPADLGRLLTMSQSTISAWLTGKTIPDTFTLLHIAERMNIRSGRLIEMFDTREVMSDSDVRDLALINRINQLPEALREAVYSLIASLERSLNTGNNKR
jgi:transcriptional regulator with XRE-family HTH domain